jgi:hypothetical protein
MTETLNTFQEPSPTEEQQNHDAEMIAKADALENAGEERPDWLPEKFKSAEDMAKAYSELEKKMSTGQKETKEEEVKETPDSQNTATEVSEVLDKAGLNFDDFQAEYSNDGGLSEKSYQDLEKSGFSRELVDSWIAGQEALANDVTQSVYESVGGQQEYESMIEWAGQNLPAEEIEAYNRAVDSQDSNLTRMAVNGLAARYRAEVGSEPKLMQGETAGTSGGTFQSAAELTQAMKDPRYQKDPAYRKSVADKLARSNVF